MMFMTRVKLQASTLSAISVRTFFSLFIRKWVAPIRALIVPNGCSTVSRHPSSPRPSCSILKNKESRPAEPLKGLLQHPQARVTANMASV